MTDCHDHLGVSADRCPTRATFSAEPAPAFTLRKMVNPSTASRTERHRGDAYGIDTAQKPRLRGCLRGRPCRPRLLSPERLLQAKHLNAGSRDPAGCERAYVDRVQVGTKAPTA